ncbi:MAG: aminotransferase class III-fold pyridoxal phosphate-dependent enzyme [Deltaproteobacteria bacterium]|nr:aminotransferase class III-fold pyridoxal phosphate-dependent enzyme [Deltaproteobacteria bacterium]
MFDEAQRLSPGGVMGIRRPYNFVPGEYPIFITHGKGGHIFDVDGNEYIDMLCSYGPIILGHVEPEIDDAVVAQLKSGFCFSLVQPWQNMLLKKLTEIIPCAEMGIIVKTGSDATTCAVRIARGFTDQPVILRCGYHGWHDWCVEARGGVLRKAYEDVHEFHYNDLGGLEKLLNEHKGNVAGIIITPVGHPLNARVQAPAPGFLEGVRELATRHGAVLIFDEIRTGFRVALGGAQARYGVTPDLAVFGKAMANGYPIAAVVGRGEVMKIAEKKVFISSTFFPNSLEMVAALKCIGILERDRVLDSIWERGQKFLDRLHAIVAASGVPCTASGIPPMPFLTFDHDDAGRYKERRTRFYTGAIRRGLFIQPFHHWYICHRHTDADLDRALDVIKEALAEV